MERRKFLLMAVTSAAVAAGAAMAQPHDRHDWHDDWRGRGDRDWRDERGAWHHDRDRYWHEGYRDRQFVDRDRVFQQLRRHHYNRWEGDPYWYHGRYGVRVYNRWGRLVFVEIDPYTGDFIGEFGF